MKIGLIINFLICGLCLGTLNGLSVSPIIQNFIGVILTLIVALITAICGIDKDLKDKLPEQIKNINTLPITLFLIGYLTGACSGIFMRANDLLGMRPNILISRWENISKGDFEILQKIYQGKDSIQEKNTKTNPVVLGDQFSGVLYADEIPFCEYIKGLHGHQLKKALLNFDKSKLKPSISTKWDQWLMKDDSLNLEMIKSTLCE